jgi:hypothetical protein
MRCGRIYESVSLQLLLPLLEQGRFDGSEKRALLWAQGNLTGIAYAEIPSKEN